MNSFSPQQLADAWAHPAWLVEKWTNEYGASATAHICQHNQSVPTTTVRLRAPGAALESSAEGISLQPGAILSSARRVQSGDITHTKAFRNCELVIQDEGSQIVAALIGRVEKDSSRILDCCAAPGGKTLAIADLNPSAKITAAEIHPHRARLMRKLLGTNASTQIKIVVADVRHLPLPAPFDRVLADVPCSGTGTLARNPEIKWRLKPEDLTELHNRQLVILRSALSQLAPAGRLVYSTCSLEKEENEDVIEQGLAEDHSVRVLDCRTELDRLHSTGELAWPDPSSLTRGPYLRTIPGVHPCDGFFAAIFEKEF